MEIKKMIEYFVHQRLRLYLNFWETRKIIVVAESIYFKKNKSEFIFKSIVIQLWSKSK